MKIEILDESPWDEKEIDQMVAQVHQTVAAGETISVPNPHYTGPVIPSKFIAPIMAQAANRDITPEQLVSEALAEYLAKSAA